MTASHRSSISLTSVLIVLAIMLGGCTSTAKAPAFKLSFLPATPLPPEPVFDDPPKISSSLYSSETPDVVQRALATPPRTPSTEVDSRILKAEGHFDAGKRLYQQGDSTGARREFDAAMDVLLSTPENLPDRQRLERRLDQMADAIYHYDLDGLGAGQSQDQVVYDKPPLDDILEMTFPTDPKLRPKVKEEIEATVSQLPLQENDAVLSYIHYFSTDHGRKVLINGLRRAGRYRPLIQRILDDEGVPRELIYLAQVESGFLPRARSYRRCVGMWQFAQFRGREYGLDQTPATDDRMDPEKATRAAARHLHDLYATFGDWYLAMAAYDCGPGCVDHAVQRTGYADYWELVNLRVLPKETANYVPLVLAITIMAKNPKDYGLEDLEVDQPVEYDSVTLESPTNLALIADATERTVPEVQELNPALLRPVAPAGYHLRVPKGTAGALRSALETVPAVHRASWRVHKVSAGDTLESIARRYATPASSIAAANHQMARTLQEGDLVVIPAAYHERATTHRARASRTRASHRAPTAYKTAALTRRHRSTAN